MGPHQSLALVFALHHVHDPFNSIKRMLVKRNNVSDMSRDVLKY